MAKKRKSTQELSWILAAQLVGTKDLHYGYWTKGLEVNVANLPKAQSAYSDLMMSKYPEGVKDVLDVGVGMGGLAKHLVDKGYNVEGVSPADLLTEHARQRLGDDFTIHQMKFEELQTDKKFDLIMFSESFQFIDPAVSLPKAHGMLNPNGHVLICDFFRTEAEGKSPMGGGHRLVDFYETLKNQPYEILEDTDITPETAPNLALVDNILQNYGIPVYESFGKFFQESYPKTSRLLSWWYRAKLDNIHTKYFSKQRNADSFAKHKSYRLLLLKKNG